MLVASIGLIRLPDVYCRMHAATKATTFGMGGILLGASLIFWSATGHDAGASGRFLPLPHRARRRAPDIEGGLQARAGSLRRDGAR